MYYPSKPIAALAVRLIRRRFPKVDYAYLRYQFRGHRLYTSADYAAMWAAWSEAHPEQATLRELLELLEDSSGKRYPLHDSATALATSTLEPTSELLRLTPPAEDEKPTTRFTLKDILAIDFVSGEIYIHATSVSPMPTHANAASPSDNSTPSPTGATTSHPSPPAWER